MKPLQKIRKVLNRPIRLLPAFVFTAAVFITGLVMSGAFASYVQYTNRLEFCLSCHEMESTVWQEYKESPHFQTKAGVRPSCADCHVPYKNWIKMVVHKIGASKELYGHFITGSINTKEKFEAKRLELAKTVWARMEANDSENCRNCHKTEAWNLDLQKPRARGQHEEAALSGETCIDCHKGIAHKPVHEELEEEEFVGLEEEEEFEPFDPDGSG